MSTLVSRTVTKLLSRQCTTCPLTRFDAHLRYSHWFPSVMALKTSPPLRAEPTKKKKVDPKREQQRKERLRKKIKRLEKVPPELIPIDDFITPVRYRDETRVRTPPQLPFEERERRALLLKEWSRYKQSQHEAEMEAITQALEAQREALEELKLESEELYCAALKPDPLLLPLHQQGPSYTPPKHSYEPPEGKYNDITKVHVQ
ncbi:39S ribosomal protein L40, mitochondrial [Anguilla anguilla]|uniref:Large ribosomal subunit protein mL40 n=1 Tax=Anguilla anguilla TaxID=7936 RepID=A0A0E9X5Z7_ANGAN|nr:39S ribosomal protein L40, mitochondrial [Anguilla anguilla]KAG5840170.1 hypothetical protein ANANG_G00186020 [Anguilla anguilla]